MLKNIRHSGIVVKNLAEAIAFYGQILGMKIVNHERLNDEYVKKLFGVDFQITYVKLRTKSNSTLLELYYVHNKQVTPPFTLNHVSFTVDNVDELYRTFQERHIFCLGEPINDPSNKHRLFFALDPSENILELVQELEKK